MEKKDSGSKTILIVVAIVLGILLIGGIIFGVGCCWLYKVGKKESEKATTPTTSTEGWKDYQNARYGFSLKYPKTFTAQESVNGDGVTLISSSPAISIIANGMLNTPNETLDDFMNATRSDLFKGQSSAEEVSAKDTTLGGAPAQERVWQFVNSTDGTLTTIDLVSALKNGNFYSVHMVIANSAYSEYSPMFGQVVNSFGFK